MGRTQPTVRDRLDRLEREWQPFRRSLRRRDQPAFDRLFERARAHADAAAQQHPDDAWRAFVFAVLLAQERALAEAAGCDGDARPESKGATVAGSDGEDDADVRR